MGITHAVQNDLCRQMAEIRAQRGESLSVFGATLAHVIDPERAPFSRQYVSGMENGRMAITPEIGRALAQLAAMLDGVGPLQAAATPVQALALHANVAGAVILLPARECALAGCRVRFVGWPAQRYCSPECRREAQKRRGTPANGKCSE